MLQRNRNQLHCYSPYSSLEFVRPLVSNLLRVMNGLKMKGALITRTVERIARDSVATITPEHPLVIKSVKATGFRKILQDLSDRLNAWKEEQKEEIKGVSVFA